MLATHMLEVLSLRRNMCYYLCAFLPRIPGGNAIPALSVWHSFSPLLLERYGPSLCGRKLAFLCFVLMYNYAGWQECVSVCVCVCVCVRSYVSK